MKNEILISDLEDIKEDVIEVKNLLLLPDNNFAVVNTILGVIVNKLDLALNDARKRVRIKKPKVEYR